MFLGRKSPVISVARLGLCFSPVGAFDNSRGIYPTGENTNYFIRHVRDEVKYASRFRGINSPSTIFLSLCDVSKKLTGSLVISDLPWQLFLEELWSGMIV
jgi:hypothetical protein